MVSPVKLTGCRAPGLELFMFSWPQKRIDLRVWGAPDLPAFINWFQFIWLESCRATKPSWHYKAWESEDLGFSLLLTLGKVIYNMREMTTSVVMKWGCTSESWEMFVENTDPWALSNIHWFIMSIRWCPGIYTFIKLPQKFYEGSSALGHWPMLGNHWIRWSPELISILIFFWFCNHTWSFISRPKWRFNKDWFTSWSKLPELVNVS